MNTRSLNSCTTLLVERNLTISFAESATAGRVSSEFALFPNAGDFLKGAIVCYDATIKEGLLNVPKGMLETFTPESMEVTQAATIGLEQVINSDIYIGITGLTKSGGSESKEKPVGTMFIYCRYHGNYLFSDRIIFEGNPEQIILQTVNRIAKLLCAHLKAIPA